MQTPPRRHYTPRYAQEESRQQQQNPAAWLKRQHKQGTLRWPAFALENSLSLRLCESTGSSVGLRTWPSAVGIARWISAAGDLAGVRVVECGAGTGLVSLTCAARGADVLATDVDKRALALIETAAAEQTISPVWAADEL